MAAGTSHRYFEAPAAESFGDDGVGPGPVEHYAGRDLILPFGIGENVAHAAQVAFALLTHISDKQQRRRMRQVEIRKRRRDRKQRGYPRRVVRYSGPMKLSALLANVQRRAGGEDGVQVRADGNRPRRIAAIAAKNIANAVLVHFYQAECSKAFGQPV